MEHNRLEIILLASGILVLVALLSIILWLGNRKRNQERRNSQESQRPQQQQHLAATTHTKGRDCLFKEVFPDHRDHDSHLTRLAEYYNLPPPAPPSPTPSRSFVAETRRRSHTFSGEQHELRDIRHGLRTEPGTISRLMVVEIDSDAGLSEESKSDAEASSGASGSARHQHAVARRRTSSAVRLHRLRPRKSQDHPLHDREKG